ncbi:MAG: UDP-N-acetylmuramoyl-L-alanyl-D-glutamate--2,6-diaminopimelate ligase [Desulfobacteraceae bacterium]|nr:UDP-N-acetylmuramoyl-L-alanyl-D-glutamate--2,6-diaminopimelate ligase [Desulfobacteraceae bacterium]
MKLSGLIEKIEANNIKRVVTAPRPSVDPQVTGIYYRSDQVGAGGVFAALAGQRTDGHDFAKDAAARGAAAVILQKPINIDCTAIEVKDTRRALADMASAFYGHPSEKMSLVGVTGTNGKTTTAFLLDHILRRAGYRSGVIGTVNYRYAGKTLKSGLTTPEAPDLQGLLAEMAEAGVTHVILEVSSHGVVLERIRGCRFAGGVFTNFSQDHLDFHGDMEQYWAAKKRFFTDYISESAGWAIINLDDKKGLKLKEVLGGVRQVRVGISNEARVRASGLRFNQGGISGMLHLGEDVFAFHSPLAGRFNLENILCAAGAALAFGVDSEIICKGIETFVSVPGRLERVPNTLDRHVFVDFSHTPAALENVLATLREIVDGRIICIFGCGGDRDRGKRPEMGEIAARYSDLAVVTSDNPRTESPERIIEDIVKGIVGHRKVEPGLLGREFDSGVFTVESDRKKAISLGIRASRSGDAVVIAGKGHETYQIIGEKTVAFDDHLEAEKVLSRGINDADTMDG